MLGGLAGLRKIDVFVSFRGDIRGTFISHFEKALLQNHINAYTDNLHERAEHLDTIFRKIEDSALSVIVFSETFATSTFCLDEVVKIVECNKRKGHKIFPVFYRVPTSDVQEKDGSFAKAIDKLLETAKDEDKEKMLPKVPKWKEDLPVAASHTGLVSSNFKDDAEFIEKIVRDVSERLLEMSPNSESKNLVGMDSRISQIDKLLHIGSDDTRIISLWGIGGSGKTTLAEEAFKRFSSSFQNRCFLNKVTEKCKKAASLEPLKIELYSSLLRIPNLSYMDLSNQNVESRLGLAKVFIVLDDVDDPFEVKDLLLGGCGNFGPGSKILITSRNDVFRACETFDSGRKIMLTSRNDVFDERGEERDHIEGLDDSESLQLFSSYAFGDKSPPYNRRDQSVIVVNYCQNNPLALRVLGSTLHKKTEDRDWRSVLEGLGKKNIKGIHDVLRISYDRLSVEQQKIFLDVACFFRGEDRDYVTEILDGCYESVHNEMTTLIERSLITPSHNKLELHDLIQKMGQDIVEEESKGNFNMGSRLWKPDTVRDVLRKKKKGVDAIEGIFLDLSKIKKICLERGAFSEMDNLRLLKFYVPSFSKDYVEQVSFRDGLDSLPDELRYLYWYGFPLESLPSGFSADYLIELNLPNSKITRLWDEVPELPNLKWIDLRHSKHLTEFPDLCDAENVERIDLRGCTSLTELHSSIENLEWLEYLNLSGCSSLEILPGKITSKELRILDLSHCAQIRRCPEVCGELLVLNLSWTAIRDLPRSFSDMKTIVLLDLRGCKNLSDSARNLNSVASEDYLGDYKSDIYRDLLDWRW